MVQPPAAAPPGIDPMILQQQQAAAQEAALQQEREKRAAETLIYKEQVKRQMEGLDPVKRMEADPNYINAVAAATDDLAKAKLRHEYMVHYKQEYDYYITYYNTELQKLSPNETLDMEPYKYEVPPLPLESAPPEEPPVGDIPPEEAGEPTEDAPPEEATEEAPEDGTEAPAEEAPEEEVANDEVFEPPAE